MKKVVFILIALQFALYSCKKQDEDQKSQNHCIYGKWKLIKHSDAEGGGSTIVHQESYLQLNDDFTFKNTSSGVINTGNFIFINDTLKLIHNNNTDIFTYRLYDDKLELKVVQPLVWISALLYVRD